MPVSPPVTALAVRLGLDTRADLGRFVSELVRQIYTPPAHRQPALDLGPAAPAVDAPRVEVPLSPRLWSDAILHREVGADELLPAILLDRRAALLCRGLLGVDDETLTFYGDHPALLAFVYEHAAAAFAAFGPSLPVHGGRALVPGGAVAVPLWEAVVQAPVQDPDAFVRALFREPAARTAYLLDAIATADPPARAFALGLWMADPSLRLARFQALAAVVQAGYREWNVDTLPFTRPLNDLPWLLLRVRTLETGAPAPPAGRAFWTNALEVATLPGSAARNTPLAEVDAAWLADAADGGMYVRGERLDQIAFAQRVFADVRASDLEEAASVVADFPRRRMLLLTLERMGVRDPALFRSALRVARAVQGDNGDAFWALGQWQAALAIVERIERVGTIDERVAVQLVSSLAQLPVQGHTLRGGLAQWIERELVRHLPADDTREARLIAAVSGPARPRPSVFWEGETYLLDLPLAERRRIMRVRSKQPGPGLDLALDLAAIARELATAESGDALRPAAARLGTLAEASAGEFVRRTVDLVPPGVPPPPDGREWLSRVLDDLERAARTGDMRRAGRAAEAVTTVADVVLAQALLSFVYAMNLGDPEGPALLGANVAWRHDFGFGRRDGEGRVRTPWAQPHQDFRPGVPWHVTGSLLGLDLALAPLSLRRLGMDVPQVPPQVPSLEREGLAIGVALLAPSRLLDRDRDRLATAIDSGLRRVRQLGSDPRGVDAVTDTLGLDGWRTRELRWTLQNRPDSVDNLFSLADLAVLGGDAGDLQAWGTAGVLTSGCLCTRMPEPWLWRVLAGRPQAPLMSAVMVDLNLHFARQFAELRLPAALLPVVLTTAMQELIDAALPDDPNDLRAFTAYVRALRGDALSDYVASAITLDGPLVAPDSPDPVGAR